MSAWVVVPVEPTALMKQNGANEVEWRTRKEPPHLHVLELVWKSMLSSCPAGPDVPLLIDASEIERLRKLLDKAQQLACIASDWNLDEVEIDGEMVSVYDLRAEFESAIAQEKANGSR